MKTFFVYLCFLSTASFAQTDVQNKEQQLTQGTTRRWVFESTKRTLGGRVMEGEDCEYQLLIFALKDKAYLGEQCKTSESEKNKWLIRKQGEEEYTLTLANKTYNLDFFSKELLGRRRDIMRLALNSRDMATPRIEYFYYGE